MDVPGDTPTSPVMTVPVPPAVTVEPPTTAKLCAAPTDGAGCASTGEALQRSKRTSRIESTRTHLQSIDELLCFEGRGARIVEYASLIRPPSMVQCRFEPSSLGG